MYTSALNDRRRMLIAPYRTDEEKALRSLRALEVLDTEPEAEFDSLVRAASLVCGTPISLISLIEAERQWFKANIGLPGVTEMSRAVSVCAHTVLGDDVLEVTDARGDARFADNPLVSGAAKFRFYAGAPVRLRNGTNVGTLCVIDRVPRELNDSQREVLRCLAQAVAHLLEGRVALRQQTEAATALSGAIRIHAQSEARFRALTESSPLGTFATDARGAYTYVNPQWQAIYGLGADESLGSGWAATLHPDDRAAVFAEWQRTASNNLDFDMQFRVRRRDGSVRYVHSHARGVQPADGTIAGFVGTVEDVTDQRRMAAELAKQHELLRVTLQSIGDAVITTDADGVVVWLNPVAERMTGWPCEAANGRALSDVFQVIDEALRVPLPVQSSCPRAAGRLGPTQHSVLVSRDGSEFSIEGSTAPICNDDGDALGVVLMFRDVTEARRLARMISHRAKHDKLTGLVNRDELELRLHHLLNDGGDRVERALLYIDLDQFKLVNDTCGHAAGDLLLQQVSKLMQDVVRGTDTVARIGGDEFAIVLDDCSAESAHRIAQKLCDGMDHFRFSHAGRRFRVGSSVGVVAIDSRWTDPAALLQAADSSCYAAKEAGRNRVHVWFDTDEARLARQGEVRWTTRIEQALDEDAFVLFAQRITPLHASSGGVHAEVLLRLRDNDGTLIPPGAFLPAAERFHLASRLDRWVMQRAIAWLKSVSSLNAIANLSVNLSGQSVGDREFHRWAVAALHAAGSLVCAKLTLEITETAAVTRLDVAAGFIEQVRAAGVRVALDDFGAGASSFGYLKSMRVDYLKIDGQFIRGLLNNPLDEAAVRCFVDVAEVAGIQTVAEFVDDPLVLERLRTLNVDFAQGFLLHKPAPIAQLLDVRHDQLAAA